MHIYIYTLADPKATWLLRNAYKIYYDNGDVHLFLMRVK